MIEVPQFCHNLLTICTCAALWTKVAKVVLPNSQLLLVYSWPQDYKHQSFYHKENFQKQQSLMSDCVSKSW